MQRLELHVSVHCVEARCSMHACIKELDCNVHTILSHADKQRYQKCKVSAVASATGQDIGSLQSSWFGDFTFSMTVSGVPTAFSNHS